MFVVCLLACWFACHVKNGSVQKTVQETEDFTKRIFLLPHGRGESDPTVLMVWAVQGSKVNCDSYLGSLYRRASEHPLSVSTFAPTM